jgi:hypothetical protein
MLKYEIIKKNIDLEKKAKAKKKKTLLKQILFC